MAQRIIGYQIKIKVNRLRLREFLSRSPMGPIECSAEKMAENNISYINSTKTPNEKSPFTENALDRTGKAKELVLADIRQHHSIAKIARQVSLNARTLQDCFKFLYGKPIFEYLQNQRLEHGKKLLAETNLTIQEIAEACGYVEHTNFTVAFKRKFGMVPGAWRKVEWDAGQVPSKINKRHKVNRYR